MPHPDGIQCKCCDAHGPLYLAPRCHPSAVLDVVVHQNGDVQVLCGVCEANVETFKLGVAIVVQPTEQES